ncbi:hypothetical protein DFR28_1051 [Arenicella xantha]|uniref:Uncharacterized protein n=1 Tax=Arenicella xantha TaxID=644221 RepID=A0A395JFU2_9GAMM|nr:hypothetical protein DFR28_1051 [Arenicella xantha]
MFGLGKRREHVDLIGVKIDITVNLVNVESVVSERKAPTIDCLANDWLPENSASYRNGVT